MKYAIQKIKKSLQKLLDNVLDFIKYRVIRPIKKNRARKKYFQRREAVQQATGELVEKLEPFLMKIFDEALSDYYYTHPQRNHWTIQATHDMRRHVEIKVKSFIKSQK